MPNAARECNSQRAARNRPNDRFVANIGENRPETAREGPLTFSSVFAETHEPG
jgi:hypothetical protein